MVIAVTEDVFVAMEEAVCSRSGVHKGSSSNSSRRSSTNLTIPLYLSYKL